jgi:Domain of unknown function (DUF4395)
MLSKSKITCPISTQKANENVARMIALFVITISLLSVVFNNYLLTAFLALDFTIRTFTSGNYSVLKFVSKQIALVFRIKEKPVDAEPKKFAASLGLFFSFSICILQFLDEFFAGKVVGSVLIFCALLEAAVSVCLGCMVYSYFILPLKNKIETQ